MLPFIPLLLFAVAVAGSSFQSGNTGSSGNRIIVDDSKTVIAFPTSEHWWCIGAINVVQWWWAPEASPQLQVVLANRNIDLLPWGTLLKDKVEAKILSTYTEDLDSALPGDGYYITLLDRANLSHSYARSEYFEIRANGSVPIINPPPYGPLNQPGEMSGAERLSFPLLTSAAAVVLSLFLLVA